MQENNINCKLNIPYPKIRESSMNRYDAQMIFKLVAGELCAINDYIYQNLLLTDSNPEVADILECIAITEMHHYKLYGRLLTLSGYTSFNNFRDIMSLCRKSKHSYSSNPASVTEILNYNIDGEKSAASDMRLIMSQINDKSAAVVLKRILMDEEHHADILLQLRHRYS